MRVVKPTPFEFSYMPWEIEPRRTSLMIVVKGTFDLLSGTPCQKAAVQAPCGGSVPWDDGDEPSLQLETDYSVIKTRGEWYLKGSAHAPGARPTTLVPVAVKIGALSKQIVVWGDRHWKRGLVGAVPSEPEPFASMPLRWERAFGGPKIDANPVGRGITAIQTAKGAIDPLPNIEDPRYPIAGRDQRPAPAGMFPIPCTWKARSGRTGTYDKRWKEQRWPFFPVDFDYGFFQCAPRDQQRDGHWVGDETIELRGLHPEHQVVRTRLPGVRARCFVEWVAAERSPPVEAQSLRAQIERAPPRLVEVPLHLDTIIIDADAMHAQCCWRGLTQIADDRLSNVERLFFVDEPLEERHPHAHYEAWLQRLILEELEELIALEPVEPPPLLPEPETPALEEPALAAFSTEGLPEDPTKASEEMVLRIAAVLADVLPERKLPSAAEARAKLLEAGIEPPPDLEEPPEPEPEVILDEPPPSLRRLAAIYRRKLGRPFTGEDWSGAPFARLDLSGVDFSGSILTGADLSRCNLSRSRFDGCVLREAKLDDAHAPGASFVESDLTLVSAERIDLRQAVLDGATATNAKLDGANFGAASLHKTWIEQSELRGADLRAARLEHANFSCSVLDGANFSQASMSHCWLEGARAHGANFERCTMPDLRASNRADFTDARFVLVDAPKAQFQGATLLRTILSGSNFEGADFSEAIGLKANFTRSVLQGARFERADLKEAVFIQSKAVEAAFDEADLRLTDFRGANLFSASLYRAISDGALLEGAELGRTLRAR